MLHKPPQQLAIGAFLLLLVVTSKASASAIKRQADDDEEPTPTSWTPISMALPWPYQSPSLAILPDDNNNNNNKTAILGMLYSNPCGGATEFASTTTINLPVDCAGASSLASVSYRFGRCPLGRTDGPPATVDFVSATPRTSFGYTCLPTPAPSSPSSVNVADITKSLPQPTLTSGQNPALTPAALEVVHHAGGECRVNLRLDPTATFSGTDDVRDRTRWTIAECNSRLTSPVTYLTTVTKTIEVGCDGCKYIRGGVVTASCPRQTFNVSTRTVEGSTTVWAYDCL